MRRLILLVKALCRCKTCICIYNIYIADFDELLKMGPPDHSRGPELVRYTSFTLKTAAGISLYSHYNLSSQTYITVTSIYPTATEERHTCKQCKELSVDYLFIT